MIIKGYVCLFLHEKGEPILMSIHTLLFFFYMENWKTYAVDTHENRLGKAILMSIQNINSDKGILQLL